MVGIVSERDIVRALAERGERALDEPVGQVMTRKVVTCASGETTAAIMERMFRRQPAILLYAPLHTVIWQRPGGPAYFTFDKPSDQFRSFADPDITEAGHELDGKLAALLDHLGAAVPHELLSR